VGKFIRYQIAIVISSGEGGVEPADFNGIRYATTVIIKVSLM